MAMNTISGAFPLQVTKDGDTLTGGLIIIGNTAQRKDKNSGKFTPDFSLPENKVIIYPNIISANRGAVISGVSNFENTSFTFNGAAVSGNAAFNVTTYTTGGVTFPALEIVGNPMTAEGSYTIQFTSLVNNGIAKTLVTRTMQIKLTEEATVSYNVFLSPDNGGVVDETTSTPNCKLTPIVDLGGQAVSGVYLKYYKYINNAWVKFGTDNAPFITVTPYDIEGTNIFKVEVLKSSTSSDVLCSDVQEIIDNSDPLKVVFIGDDSLSYTHNSTTITAKVMLKDIDKTSEFSCAMSLLSGTGAVINTTATNKITVTFDQVKDVGQPTVSAEFLRTSARMFTPQFTEEYQ